MNAVLLQASATPAHGTGARAPANQTATFIRSVSGVIAGALRLTLCTPLWASHCQCLIFQPCIAAAKQHAPEAAAAADGQPVGGAADDSHDADIAAVAGTDAVPSGEGAPGSSAAGAGLAEPAVAGSSVEAPSLAAPQPGSSGRLLLTVHDGGQGSLPGAAAGDGADASPLAGPAAGAHHLCHGLPARSSAHGMNCLRTRCSL